MCVAPVNNPMPVGDGVWSICNTVQTTVNGYEQWQDMLAPSMSTTDDVWHTDTLGC